MKKHSGLLSLQAPEPIHAICDGDVVVGNDNDAEDGDRQEAAAVDDPASDLEQPKPW